MDFGRVPVVRGLCRRLAGGYARPYVCMYGLVCVCVCACARVGLCPRLVDKNGQWNEMSLSAEQCTMVSLGQDYNLFSIRFIYHWYHIV